MARAAPEARTGGNSRWRGAANFQFAPSGAPPPLILFGGEHISGFRSCCKTRARMRRENAIARTIRPRDSGGGGPLELAQRANRGGGGACGAASLSLQENDGS